MDWDGGDLDIAVIHARLGLLSRLAAEQQPTPRQAEDLLLQIGCDLQSASGVDIGEAELGALTLEVASENADFPWELLPYRGHPVGLQIPVRRVSRGFSNRPRKLIGVRRIVFIRTHNPQDLPFLEREAAAMRGLGAEPQVLLQEWNLEHGLERLVEWVADADIVHFAGHAQSDRLQIDGRAHRYLNIPDIFPSGRNRPRLIWLNACEAGTLQPTGVTHSLLERGCPNVLGSFLPLTDSTAKKMTDFYRWLLAGQPVEYYLLDFRKALAQEGEVGWSSLVLYGKGGRLFD